MTVNFYTLGCKVNQYETELMRERFADCGYEICSNGEPDVFVINSCTVTAESDRKTRQQVRKFRLLYPNAVIVLTGCVPQAFPHAADELEQADIVVGNASNGMITRLVEQFFAAKQRIVMVTEHGNASMSDTIDKFYGRTKAFVKIEDGCNRFCSYCIIPYARGRVRSKPLDKIKAEISSLANNGFCEAVLIGINLTAYGDDIGLNLADAVQAAASIDGIGRIRLGSLEPDQFTDDIIDRLAKIDKLCPQFHLSLQSGCDATLAAMNRHYDTAFYYDLVCRLRGKFDNCAVTTDIMVGFPGETDEHYMQSLSFLKKVGFANSHVFAYSRRKGTLADTMPHQIESSEKRRRSSMMIQAAALCRAEYLNSQNGKILSVLFENKAQDGFCEGYAENFTPVKVLHENNLIGKTADVLITGVEDDCCIGFIADKN